jgi:tRNA A37 threonylcarbamoyladenosine dehydratase
LHKVGRSSFRHFTYQILQIAHAHWSPASHSNTNRQVHALSSTVGIMKIDEMKSRLNDINPQCKITVIHDFISPENIDNILDGIKGINACIDAIDGAENKSALLAACTRRKISIVTCGGSAGRTDPTKIVCDDLTRAKDDRLLSACRKILRKTYGFSEGKSFLDLPKKWHIKAVFSTQLAKTVPQKVPQGTGGSSLRHCDGALGTACFVTGTIGFVAAGLVVEMIASNKFPRPRKGFVPAGQVAEGFASNESVAPTE